MKRAVPGDARPAPPRRWRAGGWQADGPPAAPQECPVAIVIDGQSVAVLMATADDLHDLALGFALTEGMIASPAEVADVEAVPVTANGLPAHEARLWLRPGVAAGLADRRRRMLGPVGCGLCGIDSIEAALPPVIRVAVDTTLRPGDVAAAMAALHQGQRRHRQTPALHAACFIGVDTAETREDIGRHNALDKLAGALARDRRDGATGILAMTSRLSVDLVQKAARIGAPVLIGAGAPSDLAIRWAEAAGITLIGRAHSDGFDLYTHPHRMKEQDDG